MSKAAVGTGTDASSTIPGSIFSDDLPSTQSAAAGSSDNIDYTPTPPTTYNNGNSTGGGSGSSQTPQIEVNSTTQIVLITLGIAVAVLFLLGVAATYYISHKNKRACLKKEKEAEADAADKEDLEKGGDEKEEVGEEEEEEEEEDLTTLTMPIVNERGDFYSKGPYSSGGYLLDNEKGGHAISHNGYHSASEDDKNAGSGLGYRQSHGNTPRLDGVSRYERGSTIYSNNNTNDSPCTATTTLSTLVAQRSQNPRSSFIEVAQTYAHRQSLVQPVDPSMQKQRMSESMVDSHSGYTDMYQQQQQFLQYEGGERGSSGATIGSSGHSGQWGGGGGGGAVTSSSSPATEKSSLLLDPFKTNNNSMASLDHILEQGTPQPSTPPAMAPVMMGVMRTVSPPLVQQPQVPIDISYQPPSKSSDPSRIASRKSSDVYRQGVADRRSVAGWPSNALGGTDGGENTNIWHRKRASVIIPEGTAPVRLWKEDAAVIATGALQDEAPRSPLASGPVPRIGIVSEEDDSTRESGISVGYRPSVRNGAAVFEGSLPRKTTSRSPSLSRLDDSSLDSQQSSIDALGISDAPTTAPYAALMTQQSTYRRKWATGQIAVDDHPQRPTNIHTTGFQGDNNDDTEHVVVSLPSPRGCLLENNYSHHHQAMSSVDDSQEQDGYEFGMRSLPLVFTHQRGGSTATKGSTGGGGGGGRKSTELANASGARLTYLDDYREQKQQKKLQQQQEQGVEGGGEGSGDSTIKVARRRSAQFLQNALKRASLYQSQPSESSTSPAMGSSSAK
ncbi:hypothetical protein BGZ96_003000 [Linnemannia gamsii]|uniref:Uncharacterized protein n=1 Tax=Linnemannia gamsii TaxID=64522 RepID=A0ABQ7JK46_9FUNG|nr:hypothetical protein BGZ96_003000 [Linnemannia gamsii]